MVVDGTFNKPIQRHPLVSNYRRKNMNIPLVKNWDLEL